MDKQTQARLQWVELYEKTGVQDRCAAAVAAFLDQRLGSGGAVIKSAAWRGSREQSKRPLTSPRRKVGKAEEVLLLRLRQARKAGARRLWNELFCLHSIELSLATIHKILTRNNVEPLRKIRKKSDVATTKPNRFRPRQWSAAINAHSSTTRTAKLTCPFRHLFEIFFIDP